MNAAVGLMDGLGLDGDRCIRVIPRQTVHIVLIVSVRIVCVLDYKCVLSFKLKQYFDSVSLE